MAVMLDFSRKFLDDIGSVSSIFVGASVKLGIGLVGFWKKENSLLQLSLQ
jgi:hypothetical protein